MLVLAALLATLASATVPPAPTRWVEDPAGFMSAPARDALDARLAGYERATGHQVVVWIGTTLAGAPLDDWAVRTFAAWKLGRRSFDDGVALFVFSEDRKIAIEVGYGLEDELPDARASRIIREVMAPMLRAGEHDRAVTAGANAILEAIEGKPWAGAPATAPPAPDGPSWLEVLVGAAAVLGFVLLMIVHPRFAMFLLWTVASGGRGGGGLGGGGFHGGGGRSGGGGARGGW